MHSVEICCVDIIGRKTSANLANHGRLEDTEVTVKPASTDIFSPNNNNNNKVCQLQ